MEEGQDPDTDPTTAIHSKASLPIKKRTHAEGEVASESDCPDYKKSRKERAEILRKSRKERAEILRKKRTRIREIQNQAYYIVLRAFAAESKQVSSKRIMILKDLMRELKVTTQQHSNYEKVMEHDNMLKHLRVDSPGEEEEDEDKVEVEEEAPRPNEKLPPLIIKRKKQLPQISDSPTTPRDKNREDIRPITPGMKLSPSAASASSSEGWSRVSPESLIGRVIHVRLPGDDDYIQFTIAEYDEDQEQHRLESELDTMEDPCSWLDLRHIPSQDIMWDGEDPGISEEECSLKPGETILRVTSTTIRERCDDDSFKIPPLPSKYTERNKPLKEVGKVTSKTPDFGKLEKEKGSPRVNDGERDDAIERIADLSLKDIGADQT